MILLYVLVVVFLIALKFLYERRAKGLESKYTRLVLETQKMAEEPMPKQGNSSKSDPFAIAKRHFELGRLVDRRDRLEAKYFAWQNGADALRNWVKSFRDWKGKATPYVFGIADVTLVLVALQLFGLGTIDLGVLLELLKESVPH